MNFPRCFSAVSLAFILTLSASASSEKISPRVLDETSGTGSTEALIVLKEQANLAPVAAMHGKLAKGQFVVNALREVAARTQPSIISFLTQRGVAYQSFWIVNMIKVTGNRALMEDLAARPDVAQIDANPHVKSALPTASGFDSDAAAGVEWNVVKVGAPKVWALGFRGKGRVVAGADTGVQWDHPALKNHYRGWNGQKVNHNYNWHDATSEHSPVPVDPFGHGTFTVSQMIGDDGHGNQIGVAPGARYIACRNMDLYRVLPVPDGALSSQRQPRPGKSRAGAGFHQQLVDVSHDGRVFGQYAESHCALGSRGGNLPGDGGRQLRAGLRDDQRSAGDLPGLDNRRSHRLLQSDRRL